MAEYAHRFAPCPAYDIEGMERWLEQLASEGLFLTSGGLFYGYGTFEKKEPSSIRYRLQPLQKKKYYEEDGMPHQAARDLAEEYGWTFLCVIEDYAVYTCVDPDARELDTDPTIQALSVRDLYKRRRNRFLYSLLYMFWMFFRLWDSPMTLITLFPMWLIAPPLFIWILTPFTGLAELTHLRSLHKRLAEGQPLSRISRSKHRLHRCNAVLILICVLWFPSMMIYSNFADWREQRWQPLDTYTEELPFSSMEELVSGEFQPKDPLVIPSIRPQESTVLYEHSNHIAERTSRLVPRQLALQQHGTVLAEGIPPLKGSLEVTYYEVFTEKMACQLYREFTAQILRDPDFEILTLPDLPAEQEMAYRHADDILLLQDGCRVLKVAFDQQDSGTVLALEQWATTMAEVFMHSGISE